MTPDPEHQAAARFLSGAASLDDAIDQAFSDLPRKVREIVRRWALQDEPYKHGLAIRVTTLARKSRIGRRTCYDYLTRAKHENPRFFALLKQYRDSRWKKIGGFDVR